MLSRRKALRAKLRSAKLRAIAANVAEVRRRAAETHRVAKPLANEAWRERRYEQCLAQLDQSLAVSARSDALLRYRVSGGGRHTPTPHTYATPPRAVA